MKRIAGRGFRLAAAAALAALTFHWAAQRAPAQTGWTIETVAGISGTAATAQVNGAAGVAADALGNLYIADRLNNRVRKVTAASGNISTAAGTGAATFGGDGAAASLARLNNPIGVAADAAGNVYIADTINHRIRKIDAFTGIISTAAGGGSSLGDGGAATSAQLNNPQGVAADAAGNLYIADTDNHRIRKVTASTGNISTVAGTGSSGYSGDGGAATSAQINSPYGVAVDSSGNIYIGTNTGHRVRKVTASTGNISTVAGTGSSGYSGDGGAAAAAQLNRPRGVAADAAGNLYIADYWNHRIRKVDASGNISTVAGGGSSLGDGGAATAGQLNRPWGIALDAAGNLYIAEVLGYRVRKVDTSGNISTVTGTGAAGFSGDARGFGGDGGAATSARMNTPIGIALDAAGNVYITDTHNQRIRKVDAAAGNVETIAGTGSAGFSGDGAAATSAQVNFSIGIAADAAGNVYIADSNNNRIRKIDASTGNISTVAGTGSSGFSGDGGAAASAELNFPRGVAVDAAGNIYIGDTINHRIRKVDAASGNIETIAGTGSAGSSGDGGAATSAQVNSPAEVAADAAGNVYIADTRNHRIRRIDASTGTISTIAGTGGRGFSGDGAAADSLQLNIPYSVAADAAGNVYIADTWNHRVRKLTPPPAPPPGTGSGAGSGQPEPEAQPVGGVTELTFAPAEAAEPTSKTLTLRAENGAVDYQAIPSARWIEVTRAADGAAQWRGRLAQGETVALQVTVNPLGLREGTHNGRLYIRSNGRLTATIRIVLEVPPPTGPDVTENGGVLNAARQSAYGEPGLFGPRILPVAPGSVVEIRGRNFAADGPATAEGLPLPRSLGGTRVMIEGQAAPLFTVESGRIAAQLPSGLLPEGARTALASVEVETEQGVSYARFFHAAAQAPGVFTVSGGGAGQGSIVFAGTAELAAPRGYGEGSARPARAGDVLEIYATGLGALEPAPSDGEAGGAAVLRHAAASVRVWLGSQPLAAEDVLFAGGAPSLVGVNVVLARVPAGIAPNDALEVYLEVGGARSQPGVTIAVE